MPSTPVTPERDLILYCEYLCNTHQAKDALVMLVEWQAKRSQDKERIRLLAGMKPAIKPRPFRVIHGGAR